LTEKSRVSPEKLMAFVSGSTGASFTPSGILKLDLAENEREEIIATARRVLLEIRNTD